MLEIKKKMLFHPMSCLFKNTVWTTAAVGLLGVVGGCSHRPGRLDAQSFNISTVVERAMSEYDSNGDSVLEPSEMQSVPSLLAALADIDKDGDGAISKEELSARIEFWRASRIAIMPANCLIIANNRKPLAGATVTFEPEPFLADVLFEASGVTDSSGVASMSVAEEHSVAPRVRGVYCGLYRVRVSLMRNGKESIESSYNAQTTLGTEVYPNQVPQHTFRLTKD